MFGTILLILQIIGAIPQVIEFARIVWELIKKIRDRKTRLAKKRELRRLVFKRQHLKTMSQDEQEVLMNELRSLKDGVEKIIYKEMNDA